MSVNITQQRISRVISQQMLYFSQHFAEKFCLKCILCDVYGHVLSFDGHDFFGSMNNESIGISVFRTLQNSLRHSFLWMEQTSESWSQQSSIPNGDHKFNGPGLRYELALCIRTGTYSLGQQWTSLL